MSTYQPKGTVPYAKCDCYYCRQMKTHPTTKYHLVFESISSRLLVAESLDPEDRVRQWACTVCGHVVEESNTPADCYHPLSCHKCDNLGLACGDHQVGEPSHEYCRGGLPR